MKDWEEIIKDKLEGYESPLPEGGLEAFRSALSDERGQHGRKSSRPVYWLSAVAVAAACLAAILFTREPETREDEVNTLADAEVVLEPEDVMDQPVTIIEEKPETPTRRKAATAIAATTIKETIQPSEEDFTDIVEPQEDNYQNIVEEQPEPTEPVKRITEKPDAGLGPVAPINRGRATIKIKTGPLVAGVAGTGVLGAAVAILPRIGRVSQDAMEPSLPNQVSNADDTEIPAEINPSNPQENQYIPPEDMPDPTAAGPPDTPANPSNPPETPSDPYAWADRPNAFSHETNPNQPKEPVVNKPDSRLPLKLGLSAGIPLTERLRVTTGVSYSFEQYLGVPVRMDWTFASWKALDLYAGAGLEGRLALQKGVKDKATLSLVGAGGVQWNLYGRLGLFLEPELSWDLRRESGRLAVSTGLRINLGD